jgi:hypothetical protein
MKSLQIIFIALSLLVSGFTMAETPASTGVLCAWGTPGFGSDPSEILGIYQVQVAFKGGTRELGSTGVGYTDKEEAVKIAVKPVTGENLFVFDIDRGSPDLAFQVIVSKAAFTGKFAGLSPELKKEAVASTAKLSGHDLPGFCLIK